MAYLPVLIWRGAIALHIWDLAGFVMVEISSCVLFWMWWGAGGLWEALDEDSHWRGVQEDGPSLEPGGIFFLTPILPCGI